MSVKSAQSAILLGVIYLASVAFAEPPAGGYGAPAPSGYSGGGGGGGGGYNGGGGGGGYQQENYPPRPYQFNYAVADHYSGANFRQQENSDGNKVNGEYTVLLPDGRTQIVRYNADWKNGFNAEVTYQGEARYPEPPKGGYGGGGPGPGYGGPGGPGPGYGGPAGPAPIPAQSYGTGPSGGQGGYAG